MVGIRIDDLTGSMGAEAGHEFPVMLGGLTYKLSLAQVQTLIVAAIADSAPATLDTLNELAAALGDDPNFATTVASALSLKLEADDLNPINASLLTKLNIDGSNIGAAAGTLLTALGWSAFMQTLKGAADAAALRTAIAALGTSDATNRWLAGPVTAFTLTSGINFSGWPSTARKVRLHVDGMRPQTDGENLRVRLSEDGSTYKNTNYLYNQTRSTGGTGVSEVGAATPQSDIVLTSAIGNAAGESCTGVIELNSPNDNNLCEVQYNFTGLDQNGAPWSALGGGRHTASAPITAFRLFFNNGHAAVGKWWMEWIV